MAYIKYIIYVVYYLYIIYYRCMSAADFYGVRFGILADRWVIWRVKSILLMT